MSLSLNFKSVKKILVPTDGSEHSMRAAEYGISIAKMVGAQILVIFVVDEVVIDQMAIAKITEREVAERELKEDGKGYLKYVMSMAEREGVPSSSLISEGRPFERIVHVAKDLNVDLIVMGTYGRRGAERILIGSVAERVIEYASCPVLVIK
ncbi:MAG TPA: universal stress protein [Verrucomicrobiae bacterium]|nr:universal stress protein [Verrucomicrobiae bacterium]